MEIERSGSTPPGQGPAGPPIAAQVTRPIMATAAVGEDAVSVSIEDGEPRDGADKVHGSAIIDTPDTLIEAPGYAPL